MNAVYRFAEKYVSVTTLHSYTHDLCSVYRTDHAPDLYVETTQADIDRERSYSTENHGSSDQYLESLAVYRGIAEQMPFYDTVLFHGSAVAVTDVSVTETDMTVVNKLHAKCYLFTAVSGTGKSTHSALWRRLLGSRAFMVNDDKPLIRIGDDGAVVYGTPYDGKHRLSTPVGVPLHGLCQLCRGEKNRIERISGQEIYPVLLQQMYRPHSGEALERSLLLLDRLIAAVPIYRLYANMDIEAAQVAYTKMTEEG